MSFHDKFAGRISRISRDGELPSKPPSSDQPQLWKKPTVEDLTRGLSGDGDIWGQYRSRSTPPVPAESKGLYASKKPSSKPTSVFSQPAGGDSPPRPVRKPVAGSSAEFQARAAAEAEAKAAQAARARIEDFKTPEEMLAFSRKPRDVDYQPKKGRVQREYQVLGGLGPDLQSEAVIQRVRVRFVSLCCGSFMFITSYSRLLVEREVTAHAGVCKASSSAARRMSAPAASTA